MLVRPLTVLSHASAWICFAALAQAQCLDWGAHPLSGVPAHRTEVLALHVHDDGTGPALYAGRTQILDSTVDPAFNPVQRWNGVTLADVGSGLVGRVNALTTFDDGTGPALYAGGHFTITGSSATSLAKWDGTTWTGVGGGVDDTIWCLAVHDDGSGPALFVGGVFQHAGGIAARDVAKWDGSSWSALALGVPGNIRRLVPFDDGSGPALYAGGGFTLPGSSQVTHVARWQSGGWSVVGTGLTAWVFDLAVFDDGTGPALYAGGAITGNVQRWNGSTWSTLGTGPGALIGSLAVLDDGTGPKLCAGTFLADQTGVRCWNGSAWSALNPSTSQSCAGPTVEAEVLGLAMFDDGAGPRIFAGSTSGALGSVSQSLSSWDGADWQPVGTHISGIQGTLRSLHVHDDGSGAALYAGGAFCGADDAAAANIARWNGTRFTAVGAGVPWQVKSITTYDPGSGPALFAAGAGGHLAEFWHGIAWLERGSGAFPTDTILALQTFGPDLYLGGSFGPLAGVQGLLNIARWDGVQFRPVGPVGSAGMNSDVNALATFDDGNGPALIAGGAFTSGNGVPLSHIGRWNGTTWSPLGSGLDAAVDALAVFDDGSGPALYAGGLFTSAGGTPAAHVARWNGSSWSAVGAGLNALVLSLGVFDDGAGPALYAGGTFTASGVAPANRIARWNGSTWTQPGAGADGAVWAVASHDDGTGPGSKLFIGGDFQAVGLQPSKSFAAWSGCAGPTQEFCFGDGSVSACPCSNQGSSGRGCDNSQHTGGARLEAAGSTSPDTIHLTASGELQSATTLVFQGDVVLTAPHLFGDGLRCCGGNTKRMFTATAVNGALTVPGVGQPTISARSAMLGDPLTPGSVRCYQAWYRDANPTFCAAPAGNAWNLSSAVRIVW